MCIYIYTLSRISTLTQRLVDVYWNLHANHLITTLCSKLYILFLWNIHCSDGGFLNGGTSHHPFPPFWSRSHFLSAPASVKPTWQGGIPLGGYLAAPSHTGWGPPVINWFVMVYKPFQPSFTIVIDRIS